MILSRRNFLKSLAFAPLTASPFPSVAANPWKRTVVLVELNGGNDGLNTVIPYSDPLYRGFRPKLAISYDKVLRLNEKLGLHPSLERLMPVWVDRELAIVLGVGYPNPNFSHFRSIDIWETAVDSYTFSNKGWITRIFEESPPSHSIPADGIVLGRNAPGPLTGESGRIINLRSFNFLKRQKAGRKIIPSVTHNSSLSHVLETLNRLNNAQKKLVKKNLQAVSLPVEFPRHRFGRQMEMAARIISGGSGIPVIKASHGSFDTHSGQEGRHARLMEQLADGLSAFISTMKSAGMWDDVLIMTYAEFGRRPKENASGGTDHGTAAPHFVIGGRVDGGFYGEQPPLDDLQSDNLVHRVDFREIYACVARNWWNLSGAFLGTRSLPILS